MCCTCRTRREIHGKCLARKRCARPLPAHLSTIFIIKVNDFFSGCLSSRWCDTHIWFKIDVVTCCRTRGYGKYFPFDPFYYFEMFFSLVAKLPEKFSAPWTFVNLHNIKILKVEALSRSTARHSSHNLSSFRTNNCFAFYFRSFWRRHQRLMFIWWLGFYFTRRLSSFASDFVSKFIALAVAFSNHFLLNIAK